MNNRFLKSLSRTRREDWAVLYMRIFIGGAMLLHNVWKMQNYGAIIDSYPSLWGINPPTWMLSIAAVQTLLSVAIIAGLWVRVASFVMALGMLSWIGVSINESYLIKASAYLGGYLFLVIAGGGRFALRSLNIENLKSRRRV